MTEIDFDQFLAVDMRVGRVTAVDDFPEARKPAWKLTIDFGPELGTKRSSAQITELRREELEGRLVVAVVNFPPRQIGTVHVRGAHARRVRRERARDPAAAGRRRAPRGTHPLTTGAAWAPGSASGPDPGRDRGSASAPA
jgi:tRNA-binding protein